MLPSRLIDVYGPDQLAEIQQYTQPVSPPLSAEEVLEDPSILQEVEIIFGSWGMPVLDPELLSHATSLKAIFYGAGTVRSFMTEESFEHGILLTNAQEANAVPVAEYCVSTILFSLKLGFRHLRSLHREKHWHRETDQIEGCYEANVGLISLGSIGRKTLKLLRSFNLRPLVYSTSLTVDKASQHGAELVGLEEIFARCSVISLHTPELPDTRKMIKAEHFRKMKPNATFINTARGGGVDQVGMITALRERPDITAILDVLDPEPPEDGDAIFDLPNVFITPHIAGSLGNERRRLGQTAIDECKRYLSGLPLQYEVKRQDLLRMA